MKKESIVYVNFSPYENVGNILDFILDQFKIVILFSLKFHKLGKKQEKSKIIIFVDKKAVKEISIFQLYHPKSLLFLFLPVRSIIQMIQIILNLSRLKKQYGVFEYYFSFNAYTAYIGNVARKMHLIKKTIYWASDYYPPIHPNKIIMFMRWLYWQFDKTTTKCDKLIFINEKLQILRKDIGILPQYENYPVIPLGTNPIQIVPQKKITKKINFCFFGVIKKSQGLDLFLDKKEEINKTCSSFKLHIIGSGPDESYVKKKVKQSQVKAQFYGLLTDEKEIAKIFNQCHIGLAPFIPEDGNVAYYGDPSKIKKYLSFGLPVITTNVFAFAAEIRKYKAGIIIDYYKEGELSKALNAIIKNYDFYKDNALKLANKYNYKQIYPMIFSI